MDALTVIVLVSLVMFASGLTAAFLAIAKNRDVSFWAAWGFLFPPSLIMLFMLSRIRAHARAARHWTRKTACTCDLLQPTVAASENYARLRSPTPNGIVAIACDR